MNYRIAYLQAFERDCFELINHAYTIAIKEKNYSLDWYENDFSELLCNYVNESTLSLEKGITCKTENKIFTPLKNQVKGFADRLPRIDFVYFKIWNSQKRFYCHMEAKRLKANDSNLKREYITEGMDRYILEKYPIGFILGYHLEGKVNETITGINALLVKYKRDTEILNLKQDNLLKAYYESSHSNIGILKHLIFDFTSLSN